MCFVSSYFAMGQKYKTVLTDLSRCWKGISAGRCSENETLKALLLFMGLARSHTQMLQSAQNCWALGSLSTYSPSKRLKHCLFDLNPVEGRGHSEDKSAWVVDWTRSSLVELTDSFDSL